MSIQVHVAKSRTKYFTLVQCTFKIPICKKNARLHILQDLGLNKIKMQIDPITCIKFNTNVGCAHSKYNKASNIFVPKRNILLLKYFFNGSIYSFISRISFTSEDVIPMIGIHIVFIYICIGWCACGLNFCNLQAYKTTDLRYVVVPVDVVA